MGCTWPASEYSSGRTPLTRMTQRLFWTFLQPQSSLESSCPSYSRFSSLGVRLASRTNGTPPSISLRVVSHTGGGFPQENPWQFNPKGLLLRGPRLTQHSPERPAWVNPQRHEKSWAALEEPKAWYAPRAGCGGVGTGGGGDNLGQIREGLACLKKLDMVLWETGNHQNVLSRERVCVFKRLLCRQNGGWSRGSIRKHLCVHFHLVSELVES